MYGSAQVTMSMITIPDINAKDFSLGFLTGMRATSDVTDGYACVGDITTQVSTIEDAISKIKTLRPSETIKALEELVQSIKTLVDPNGSCAKTLGEGNVWFNEVKSAFTDPTKRE